MVIFRLYFFDNILTLVSLLLDQNRQFSQYYYRRQAHFERPNLDGYTESKIKYPNKNVIELHKIIINYKLFLEYRLPVDQTNNPYRVPPDTQTMLALSV